LIEVKLHRFGVAGRQHEDGGKLLLEMALVGPLAISLSGPSTSAQHDLDDLPGCRTISLLPCARGSRPAHKARSGRHPPVSAGYVKKPDLLRVRPVEYMDRLGGGLQYYLAPLLREISLSLPR